MAAGEYVAVQSQADTQRADIAKETRELAEDPHSDLLELTHIYVKRGLQPALAREVAEQLTAHDALASHARDELGITEALRARRLQAALARSEEHKSELQSPLRSSYAALCLKKTENRTTMSRNTGRTVAYCPHR